MTARGSTVNRRHKRPVKTVIHQQRITNTGTRTGVDRDRTRLVGDFLRAAGHRAGEEEAEDGVNAQPVGYRTAE